MCPTKEILSIYYDGELPIPFQEKVKAHVAACSDCAGLIAGFSAMSSGFGSKHEAAALDAAQHRVWAKLETAVTFRRTSSLAAASPWRTIWRREVRLPLPVAAAAALLVIFAAALFIKITNLSQELPLVAGVEDVETLIDSGAMEAQSAGGLLPVSNIHDVLQYLEDDGESNILIIKLPESKNFNRYGEPRLINASDHPRSMPR